MSLLQAKQIPCDPDYSLHATLGDPLKIREWNLQNLPRDDFSIDNAIILHRAVRWGLLIDPQNQANKWLKTMEIDNQLVVVKPNDTQFTRQVANAVQFGYPLLIENVDESIDNFLEPLLLKQYFKQGGRWMIQLGGEVMEYNRQFRMYLTSKLSNPHYPPEVSTKVTLINFMITPEGLEDQMLGVVVSKERPELEKERNELIVKSAENQKQLQGIQDKILELLSNAQGNILDDEELINFLQKSKVTSANIEKRVAAAAKVRYYISNFKTLFKNIILN